MYLDFSPYFDLLKRKKPLSELTDAEVDRKLSQRRAILDKDRRRSDCMMVAGAAYFSFPIAGFAMLGMGLTGGLPLLGAFGIAYGIYKGGEKLLCAATVKAVRDKIDLEAEVEVRDVRHAALKAETDRKLAEEKARAIVEEAARAKEAFNKAINDGLPLEQAIQIRKSPLTLKSRAAM